MTLAPTYRNGTHRLLTPEQTLTHLEPRLADFGITHCTDVSGLDADLGVPVYIATRPRGRVFQSAAGKGLSVAAAKVSALMEAVELDVAERSEFGRLRRASQAQLRSEGARVDALPEWVNASGWYFSEDLRIAWLEAEDLVCGGSVWLPAGAAYFCEPTPCRTTSNGLASGNHLVEATLHGLYEVIERDTVARLAQTGRLDIARDCRVIDPTSIGHPALARIVETIGRSPSKLVLLQVQTGLPIPTFWALLLSGEPSAITATLTAGFGTHLDTQVAMASAITEAVQSHLTALHSACNDTIAKPAYIARLRDNTRVQDHPAYRFFGALEPEFRASDATYEGDLPKALDSVVSRMRAAGHERVYRADLGCPAPEFAVVKIVAPTLRFNRTLF